MKTKIIALSRTLLADLQTPVSIYLKVRDMYPQSALLESSDYHSSENSFSYIGVEPIARFSVRGDKATMQYPDGELKIKPLEGTESLPDMLNAFVRNFEVEGALNHGNGFFGYTGYDAVSYFEDIELKNSDDELAGIPEMTYLLYRFVIAVDHMRNEMTITENLTGASESKMDELLSVIDSRNFPTYDFRTRGEASSDISDEQYKDMVSRGISHCLRGDVFQIVLSRRFQQPYIGDDFKVYRALRSVNPSPYLFYFDFGAYRIFGSSPETHLKITGNTATIDPIAGTFLRTQDDERDQQLARELLDDPKENAEHVMLVDLARNDLSRNAHDVRVKYYKEIQFYSHVIHMVSRVCGEISPDANRLRVFADTFPAGTLSGAPKVRAMQLIDEIEPHSRGIYGGCIGHIGFNGDLNQAITIRTFVSRNNTLYYQAGAGIVAKSEPAKELAEVNNKLGALNRAIEIANELKN
ncbi:MAG: anthranilate synthase component I family protein [Rikenellaceae bacterium]|jgi:anthranilate synthase component 1|nr:anthranilate synthase component I family protein [Rikenellaceae bacterium]